MNYKTMLLATAAVLFTSQAMAADLTNPFYTPDKGQITSETKAGYYRAKGDSKWVEEGYYASETLEYGITDNFSINGTIANMFDTQGEYNNDHNFEYNIGFKYNVKSDKVLFQAAINYDTYQPQSWYGKPDSNKWSKELYGGIKLGYDMEDGWTPYVGYALGSEIDTGERELGQSFKAGVHKYSGKYAVDAALRYDYETHGKNTNETWVEASVDYYLKDNVALGVYGEYFIDGTGSSDVDYDYDAGIRLKVLF